MSEVEPAKPARLLPWAVIIACLAFVIGAGLSCYGIYLLAGLGWTLLLAAMPFFALAAVIFRGLLHGK